MPVYSMTGYASASAGGATNPESGAVSGSVSVELRSVNGRFLDLSLRLPDELRSLEPALRELVSGTFKRGKIELRVSTGRDGEGAWPQPTPQQLHLLSRLESTVQGWMSKAPPLSVHEVLQWCRSGGTSEQPDEIAMEAARAAVEGLREAREREGGRLVAILMERVQRLRELAAQAEPLVPQVVQRQQQRFLERWREALATAGAGASVSAEAQAERALSEAAAYAIRIDVAEELSRLKAHLDEIERLLAKGGELGKRLDFLIQELHREANTLGSKSAALELTSVSVEMKVAIEQMREQVQNIE
ncbi:YicC/YloC family endoribonuclease [Azohydromonas lata]|uniref:YicC/YloC family endoribonuclease n=1 Tax=Azohydromonas lata TaxID=45677 RepID=A0ABU5IEY4_9BURK|nr:YicC/YloC family endoribonuclease [Azohydromonas lata]MDZ5457693.1 YicC/YloC family endoribonuclease [Azohydromonas lata]